MVRAVARVSDATPVGALLDALFRSTGRVPRRCGDRWTSPCPAHDDSSPSLSVSVGADGRALLRCHAGCDWRDVLASLELRPDALFAEPLPEEQRRSPDRDDRWTPRGPWSERYLYADEHGREIFTVHRVETVGEGGRRVKEFPCSRPDAAAPHGRRWSLGESRRVPFRLPEMLLAIRDERVIFVAEGERDVHALVRAGYPATTLPGGGPGNGWRPEYAEHFRGADVALCADDDAPGRARAERTAAGLTPVVRSLAVYLPLTGKDARDHLEAGHPVRALREVAEPVPFPAESYLAALT